MSGNTLGKVFTVTTAGESHGPALMAIVDGCPPGLALQVEDIQPDLDRRRPGQSSVTTPRCEADKVEILSGVFEGKTTGMPIALLIRNTDARSVDYSQVKDIYRPGHADFTYHQKYGVFDYRGGGRASARTTAVLVAAGAIAKKYLQEHYGTVFRGYATQIGPIRAETIDLSFIDKNPFHFPDAEKIISLEKLFTELRDQRDSVGAKLSLQIQQVPIGWGEPLFEKLDADLAQVMMGLNAVKAVEIGDGVGVIEQRGSEHRDAIDLKGFKSDHSGGILGGISTGQDILVHMSFKPTSSVSQPIDTITHDGKAVELSVMGRHDPCVGIRAVPIVEALAAIVCMDKAMQHKN